MTFPIERIRQDFPILSRQIDGKPLVYLDSANTAQKPQCVIDAVRNFYQNHNANVARAVHTLGSEATEAYEAARTTIAQFIGAHREQTIFTSGTTQAINLVAYSFVLPQLSEGDEILVTEMEHHANIVPWQLIAQQRGARIVPVRVHDNGELDIDAFERALNPRVKIAAFTHVSNVLGTINPVQQLCKLAKKHGIPTLIDGSQAAPHLPVNVTSIGCDFYVFTGHKCLAPTGTGVLWAKREHLEAMPPFFGGGEMIREVRFDGTTFNDAPHKFEAGTPNIAGFIGLGAAIDYLNELGMEQIAAREQHLSQLAEHALTQVPGLRLIGTANERAPVFSFLIDGIHAHDLATMLDTQGIAVRSGQHCAHPLMQRMGVTATCRASFAFYNLDEEVEALVQGIEKVRPLLQ